MKRLKLLGAAALLTATLPLAMASTSLAADGPGPGPCTRPGNYAVGPEGPAMNGGQLMAGVGQCQRIGGGYHPPGYGYGNYGYYHRRPETPYAGPGYY